MRRADARPHAGPPVGYDPAMSNAAGTVRLAAASGASAEVAVGRGLNLFSLKLPAGDGGPVVDVLAAEEGFPDAGKPSHSGVPVLFPFPNRLAGGQFVTDQQSSHLLPLGDGPGEVHDDGNGNAIHGFALDRPWRVTEQTGDAVAAEFDPARDAPDRAAHWPGTGTLVVRYALSGSTLRADLTVTAGGEPFPFGLGTHPYFKLPLGEGGTAGDCRVTLPAAGRWVAEAGIPTGEVADADGEYDLAGGPRYGDLSLDDYYTRVTPDADGTIVAAIEDPAAGLTVTLRCDAAFGEQVVFTPPWFRTGDGPDPAAGGVCIEPYTCATDAANLTARGVDAGWRVLGPGETFETWFEIAAGRV